MIFNTTLTPLYAEEYLRGGEFHHQLSEGRNDDHLKDHRSPVAPHESELPKRAQCPAKQLLVEQNWQQVLHDVSPTSTESGSEDFCPETSEDGGKNNDIFVRKLSWSALPKQPVSSESFSGKIDSDSIPEDQLLPREVYKEINGKDKLLTKLTKQLNRIQRQVIDLEVDRHCQNLGFGRKNAVVWEPHRLLSGGQMHLLACFFAKGAVSRRFLSAFGAILSMV